jgi:hypothetical protein
MGDYNKRLSELHRRVAAEVLGVSATIDEFGWIQCQHEDMGEFEIVLREYSPEHAQIVWRFFDDDSVPRDLLLRVCNTVNNSEDAMVSVADGYNVVRSRMSLLLGPTGQLPSESLLRQVIGPAVQKVVDTANVFMTELEKGRQ